VKAQRLRATLRRAVRVVKAREDSRPARGTTREETGAAARVAGRVAVTNRRAPERGWPRPQAAARRRAKKAPLRQDQDQGQNQMDKRGLNPAAPINKAEGRPAKVVKALKAAKKDKVAKKDRVTKKARAPIR
jgi:hypothetical protein